MLCLIEIQGTTLDSAHLGHRIRIQEWAVNTNRLLERSASALEEIGLRSVRIEW